MTDGQFGQALLTLVGVLIASYLTYRASIRANRTQQIAATATQQNADEARMKRMREDLSAAEAECATLRRQVAVLTREAEQAVVELQFLRRSIWRDGMTIERLREFVGPDAPPSPNGTR